jgi:adenylosuccinate lyase
MQTVMRRYGVDQPYERLKALTRGKRADRATFAALIDSLALPAAVKQALLALRPDSYTGNAAEQARRLRQ